MVAHYHAQPVDSLSFKEMMVFCSESVLSVYETLA